MSPTRLHDFQVGDSARVRAAVAPMMTEARISASLSSQLTSGHVVMLREQRGEWWLVRGEDDYDGWMHRGYLEPCTGDEADWPLTTGAIVRRADGLARALPFGARVAPDSMVLTGDAHDDDERARQFPPYADAVAHSAEALFVGASYLWGGVTPWGCDCSGFVQSVAAMHSIALPRDAWQQAEAGDPVDASSLDSDLLRPADLLFFSDRDDRRITHVAWYLAGGRFVHSAVSRGGVTVESLRVEDAYVDRLREQFLLARRIVSVN